MPGVTPVLGIRYPCGGDTIDPGVFQSFTNDIQAALLVGDTAVAQASDRPSVKIQGLTVQTVPINVATSLGFDTEVYDNDDMADLAVDNGPRIVTPGLYLCGASAFTFGGYTTITSMAVNLTVNGVVAYRRKTPGFGFGGAQINRVLLDLNLGDYVRAETRWTGTGGPANISFCELTASLIATH